MRVGVLGAGAVGGTLAALLAAQGNDVTVTLRGDAAETVREHGIRVSGAFGELSASVRVADRLTEPQDLVLVTTKAMDAVAAISGSAGAAGSGTLIVVQNGLEAIPSALAVLPDARILGGLALFAASLLSPGEVRVTASGALYVGPADAADPAVAVLAAALPTTAVRDFRGLQWTKLVVNQVNALPAITGLSVQEVVADRGLRRLLTRSIQETVRTGRASGVRFGTMSGLSDPLLRLVGAAPPLLAEALPRLMARRMGSVPNPGSTLQSIRRGRLTEVDYLNGAVLAAAQAAGRTAPVNEALTGLVHEVERTGQFLLPAEVVRRIPA
ncbi:MAG: 2-dehydropantoate 2-reductase [Naasia sp.]|uniref:ketopantoate reductase family protein n=1 Tax=Naasia sp. TaxID=2546198 RepID=UPI00262027F7|nr:2-dehydropantoate 2-reductase [Naasia sp.]MCU1571380.1 2-dehydropantoate 2-reductase [Naasia sp.]